MSWAGHNMWRNRSAAMYLGRGLCLLQVNGQVLLRLEHSPTLPITAVLELLTERCKAIAINLSGLQLKIDLSAALCSGYILANHSNPLTPVVRQQIAQTMRIPVSNLALRQCAAQPQLVAGTTQALINTLSAWAMRHRVKMHAVQALWSTVTHADRAKPSSIAAIILHEPDGATLFSQGTPALVTPVWQYLANQQEVNLQDIQRQLLQAQGLQASQAAVFKFLAKEGHAGEPGLSAWPAHWEAA